MTTDTRIWRLLAALPLLVIPVQAQPTDWQAGIARITTSKDLARAPGTAFVVAVRNGNAYLVTSAHVVEGDPNPQVEFVAEPEKVYQAAVRGIEPEERGLALLVVNNAPGGVRAIPESPQAAGLGASVAIAGFPASLNRFSVVDTAVASTGGRDLFLSREADEGFSGGPVIIAGSVAGIVYGREGGFGKALGASSIKPFIEGNSLVWESTGVPNQALSTTQGTGPSPAPNGPSRTTPLTESAADILRSIGRNSPLNSASANALIPGQTRENAKDSLTYVWIPPGKFAMGCSPGDSECLDNEKPAHEVTITRGFWMGRTEVTVGAYGSFHKVPAGNGIPTLPVVNVTWDEAKAYCDWAGLRLPTEAEWEYAARAGTTGPRYGGLEGIAWHSGNSGGSLNPIGRKEPNALGLYDTLGNAAEWVADWHDNYQEIPGVDPTGPQRGEDRMWRGGSLKFPPEAVRVSVRSWDKPTFRNNGLGFRCSGDLR